MPRLDTVLVLLLAMPASTFANTDNPVRNTVERHRDRRPLTLERAWAERDARELSEFEAMTGSLKDALQDRMATRYRDVNENVLRAMDREIEQAAVKADQATSRRQARNRSMEAAVGGNDLGVLQAVDDRDSAPARHDEMARIGTMAGALQNEIDRGDRSAMKKSLALAEQFLEVMRRDAAAARTDRPSGGRF